MSRRISVIVPVLNRANLIERCLESIYNQTYNPMDGKREIPWLELLVVDNGSNDDTVAIVTRWKENKKNDDKGIDIRILEEGKRGASRARNKGLKESKGEYVIFFDSDDMMHPDLIRKAMSMFYSDPELDIVVWRCAIQLLDGSVRVPSLVKEDMMESHLIHSLLRPQGYMAKREVIEKAGCWNENLPAWNDWELGLRLLLRKPKIKILNEILAEIYSQKDSITGERFSDREGIWEKAIKEGEKDINGSRLENKDKEKLRKIINYRKAILAAHYRKEGNKTGANHLLEELKEDIRLKERLLLKFAYYYTSLGLRGAWRLIGRII